MRATAGREREGERELLSEITRVSDKKVIYKR